MKGRLVRKTLSFSKELRLLTAASALEDALYNFTRPLKTLRVELAAPSEHRGWQQRTPAMAARLTDHIWTGKRAFDWCARSMSYQHLTGRPSTRENRLKVRHRGSRPSFFVRSFSLFPASKDGEFRPF